MAQIVYASAIGVLVSVLALAVYLAAENVLGRSKSPEPFLYAPVMRASDMNDLADATGLSRCSGWVPAVPHEPIVPRIEQWIDTARECGMGR